MYRYRYDDILIDFIPFEDTPLGPTNRWLKPGFKKAYSVTLGKAVIKILPVSYFLATKWEAYKSRGDEPRMSYDFEDIIYEAGLKSLMTPKSPEGDFFKLLIFSSSPPKAD
ncbi:MAG: hypothetical protein K9I68_03025 [Bacteroidales bacterium]|nr:hypothetical protein [Bacteroidales bacterium]MCF8336688.1 hypothetical protein [Bacteroidales bacterium]